MLNEVKKNMYMWLLKELKEDLHEYGIFFVIFYLMFLIPGIILMLVCDVISWPFVTFNDWSKTWFGGE